MTISLAGFEFYDCEGISLDLVRATAAMATTFNKCRKYWTRDMIDGYAMAVVQMGWRVKFAYPTEFNNGDMVAFDWVGDER